MVMWHDTNPMWHDTNLLFSFGAGNGRGAKFATIVAVSTSSVIGIFFWLLIIIFREEFGLMFSNSVAVGSGWQSYVAYINLGCYYLIGLPLGIIMGWVFNQGVMFSFHLRHS
uniref:Uncharacterized protein n=1 Tax=Kalanchoe fedtschenkoi TaxID=63787 RepID=A0A7N0TJ88_KALFE